MESESVWLTPLILLPGVALLIISTSARYGQVHSEIHRLLLEKTETSRTWASHILHRSPEITLQGVILLKIDTGPLEVG